MLNLVISLYKKNYNKNISNYQNKVKSIYESLIFYNNM